MCLNSLLALSFLILQAFFVCIDVFTENSLAFAEAEQFAVFLGEQRHVSALQHVYELHSVDSAHSFTIATC